MVQFFHRVSMLVPTASSTKPDKFDSADLVLQIVLKNSNAFSYLYDTYSPALFGYIKRKVKCSRHAEEILHDVFIKIWNSTDTYCSSKTSYFTWMMAIAKTETNDYLRNKEAKVEPLTLPFTAAPEMAKDCLNAFPATSYVQRSLP